MPSSDLNTSPMTNLIGYVVRARYSHVSIHISTTRGAMVKRTAALDSAHQICLSTCTEDVLIVVGGSSSLDLKKQRNWSRFNLYLHDQGWYGKTDDSIGFSASNMSIHVLGRCSNCSWRAVITGLKKPAKLVTFQFISPQS